MSEKNATVIESRIKDTIPVEAPCLRPDTILGKTEKEIADMTVLAGNCKTPLGELFSVRRSGDERLVVRGPLEHVKRIGQEMNGGTMIVEGDPGMHLGEKMIDGEIRVIGSLPDWCCCNMNGGLVRVEGNAGNMTAAALPGESRGMRGGILTVSGDTGARTGDAMRRGLIAIGGNAGEFAGSRMVAGTIAVFGRLSRRAGGGMKRGSILAFGGIDELLPSFSRACRYRPVFIDIYLRRLETLGLPVDASFMRGLFTRWTGDCTSLGKGEILQYETA